MSTKSGTKKPKAQGAKKKVDRKEGDDRPIERDNGRINQRIPIQLLVDYRCDGNYLFDFCRDLGTGGVFIETKSPLEHGSTVDLVFTLPDSKETLEAKGKVIWVQSEIPGKGLTPGMGVQFDSFDARQRKVLEDFVSRYRSGKPSPKDGQRTA
ncbi:MAG: TIGR02266 family protein [Oligoflexales bacterium]